MELTHIAFIITTHLMVQGRENKIDCISGIFLRKSMRESSFFCKLHPQLVSDKKKQHKHPIQNHMNERGLAIKSIGMNPGIVYIE